MFLLRCAGSVCLPVANMHLPGAIRMFRANCLARSHKRDKQCYLYEY